MIESLPAIRRAIREATGSTVDAAPEPVGGGCIHRAFRIGPFFVKTHRPDGAAMFEAEADGLRAIAATGTIRVPEPIAHGSDAHSAFLVLEWLDLRGAGDDADLGGRLAAMHGHLGQRHGWERDNFIGSTPQSNEPAEDWAVFFRDRRLSPMFRDLAGRGMRIAGAEALLERVPALLDGANARPSLLHGDLWGGNAGFLRDGTPVIYDPALYHGHYEADLAMTRLFGGFGPRFYQAHHAVFPAEPGHEQRTTLYNLYHILNHALLFGGGYTSQAQAIVNSLRDGCAGVAV
jgi:protein-ribulosamine 3-kinase